MDNLVLEKKIEEVLEKKAEEIRTDDFASQRIRANVYSRLEEAEHMKKRNWKKTALVAAAICILGSITAMGLGKTETITSGSSRANTITSFAAAEARQGNLDTHVKMIEKFSNGYTFKEAVPTDEVGMDKDGNVTGKETTLHLTYVKDGAVDVSVSSGRLSLESEREPDVAMALEDGTELKYSTMMNKFVPAGYEITEEEKKLQEEGKLNIGIGASEIRHIPSSSVIWTQDEITYCLFTFSQDMSADEMLGMAREIAESE